jgi:hypothetical protein
MNEIQVMINDEYLHIRHETVMHLARQTKEDQKASEDSKNLAET